MPIPMLPRQHPPAFPGAHKSSKLKLFWSLPSRTNESVCAALAAGAPVPAVSSMFEFAQLAPGVLAIITQQDQQYLTSPPVTAASPATPQGAFCLPSPSMQFALKGLTCQAWKCLASPSPYATMQQLEYYRSWQQHEVKWPHSSEDLSICSISYGNTMCFMLPNLSLHGKARCTPQSAHPSAAKHLISLV